MAKFPFLARVITEYGGGEYYRCKTLEEAKERAINQPNFRTSTCNNIRIVRRYVTDTKGNVLWEQTK